VEGVYDNPKYYEIAFSFRDSIAEVDVLERAIERFSRIPVRTVLELGCGPAPHLDELTRRGYQYIGLDSSSAMLEYAMCKADRVHSPATFVLADMTDFRIEGRTDFVFVLLGSLQAASTEELHSHFDSVSRSLKRGGLYFLDWCVSFEPSRETSESWEMAEGHIKVITTSRTKLANPVEQIYDETLTLEVQEGGNRRMFQEAFKSRQMYPQEFLLLVGARRDFEFVGWWNNWDLGEPLSGTAAIVRPITVLRRA